ncbi:MAG: hypothetical protein ABEJ92_08420 [Halobacteriales archaeon]
MAVGDDIGTLVDERGDTLETVFWGSVFLFTVLLFFFEFGNLAFGPEEEGILPLSVIADFEQSLALSAILGGGGVVLLVIYSVFRYGAGVRDAPAPLSPGQGSFKLGIFVLAVLAIMLTTVFVGASTLAQTDEASAMEAAEQHGIPRQLDVNVAAAQWFWRFDVAGIPFDQGERVVLPADTVIHFTTTSADVIHSFSIKSLGITKDAIPAQTNEAWFSVRHVEGETQLQYAGPNGGTRTVPADTYEVRCAELCGKGHSKMIATIYVVSVEHYEAWAHAVGGEAAFESTGAGGGGGHGHAGGGH